MARFRPRVLTFSLVTTVTLVAAGTLGVRQGVEAQSGGRLIASELRAILNAGEAQANKEDSLLRRRDGLPVKTRMHIAICDRAGRLLAIRSMTDAWEGSIDIAIAKARTAALFSSNQNALSSRDIGILSQSHLEGPGAAPQAGPLWGIGSTNQFPLSGLTGPRNGLVTFPGGVALYKSGVLVGGVGVSGDGVDQDEAVAIIASRATQNPTFEAPAAIRSTMAVPALPYTRAVPTP